MKRVIAFADEFGNNSFDFENQGSHFIIASVIMNQDELPEIQEQLESIRKKYFQTGEIKSSKVKYNHKRRILILKELQSINFSVYAVVIDKRKLFGEGFKFKQSFYKFLNGILYKELYRTFPQLELKVDEHGGNDFMRSFKKYVEKNHIRNLFTGSEFNIKKSHNDLGVQLADFMAGTLGYIFDENKKSDKSSEFAEILSDKLISLNQFPKEYKSEEFNEEETFNEYDDTIATLGLNRVFDYIDKTTGNSQDNLDRLNFAKLLLLYHQSNHPKKYTTSAEFIKHLNVNRQKDLSKEQFSSKIIGHLRDNGLLIASSRDGYKIPTSAHDMKKFIKHGKSIVFPVLRRIEECRNAILLATTNEYDILNEKEFEKLKELINNVR
ncbi:DUF3800 domain-containing protein [Euzebyella marina]|uniref:DUF3800 domain-containing protein n=1 Tax=Euzebyella marina TaxID=1761453 RepID=A0A3G2L4E5_9FLAO|nr:DUF3800 domain-containing protein [Euzebyella marina]AYN67114.1 DUF3800 domain-containing protein [Euzebyella marina]